jgi:sulfite reductase (NADPH) hemoprotein beta-component
MYVYDAIDQRLVDERVAEYRDQVRRFLEGKLGEDEFRPLRLKNGLYHQLHAYMLRVSIPYGLLSTRQLRMLAHIARKYDRGFGHFTTRQCIQYNWPKLEETPDILADLATVQMHAIQTSGACVRNITADHLAGIAVDEVEDPRPWCEIVRQWSALHPEFSYLPRKFKIAFSGSTADRAATAIHDIGFRLVKNDEGEIGFSVLVGGGLGRTPMIGAVIEPFLAKKHLLSYTEAILRAYNLAGNRDNMFRARIKILVRDDGPEQFRARVLEEWHHLKDGPLTLTEDEINRVRARFVTPEYRDVDEGELPADRDFQRWLKHNTAVHKVKGYRAAYISLKTKNRPPGDATADEMDFIADVADRFSFGRVVVTHTQNLLLPDVEARELFSLWQALRERGLAAANIGSLQDIICCPGLDFCNLANSHSIPVAKQIFERFEDLDYVHDLGELKLKMSGCINSCGHHHVGHIGILGVDMQGTPGYQILLGGAEGDDAALGRWIGPALLAHEVPDAIEKIIDKFVSVREGDERFLDAVRRVGLKPFARAVYGDGSGQREGEVAHAG